MPITPLRDILAPAFAERYGVPAINVFDDLSLEGVLSGAVEARSPVIVQTSVKTVRAMGGRVLFALWSAMTEGIEVPVCLHLDHCPDREVIRECLALGWNSVLFDASRLPVEENQRQTIEVVAEARGYGADVEGEIESITGQEDGIGSDEESARQTLEVSLAYLEATGVDVFAPAIGNAHGTYKRPPVLDFQRVSDLVAAHPLPIALHGGSGLTDAQFADLIARGCAKVNISTALKERYLHGMLASLQKAEAAGTWEPLTVFGDVGDGVRELAVGCARTFGSAGRA